MSDSPDIFSAALKAERRSRTLTTAALQCAITAVLLFTPAVAVLVSAVATILTLDGAAAYPRVIALGRLAGLVLAVVTAGLGGAALAHAVIAGRLNRQIGWDR